MKIFAVFRRSWLIVLTVILLVVGDICYIRFVKNSMTRACGGRTISAGVIRSNMTVFAITVDNKAVYAENDENNDGKADYIIHFENGLEQYTTRIGKPGNSKYRDREVVYYGDKGDKYTLYDIGETCMFTQRIWESQEGKMVKEDLVEGRWEQKASPQNSK
ncbi:MAG: hypothetical protein PHW60_14250 [Kiritimatiellae bacterium]|nr:hypothetical protein [Kiritimatiellia bacterium]